MKSKKLQIQIVNFYRRQQLTNKHMSSSILFPTNQYSLASKSSEEIQRLSTPLFATLDEALSHIIAKGLPAQFQFLYRNMHKAHKITLQAVCSKAVSEDAQNQISIAISLKQLLKQKGSQLTSTDLQLIFQTCLECLNNINSIANEEMGQVLQATIRWHPENRKLIRRLEEVALQLGRSTQPIISKVTAARLISMLAAYLGRMIKGQMIDVVKRVLADNQIQARKVWVSQIFPRLLKNLQLQFIELHLQQKIYESVWDQNEEIAVMALQVILKNTTKFSVEEQSSRIAKLFIDSLTSKREKLAILATQLMGEAYQKLLNNILRNQQLCVRFWKSLIELCQSKNQTILYNLAYNLPGILIMTAPIYKIDPMCDVYIQLFYHPHSNKLLLASYFHQIAILFPSKSAQLKQLVYWMFNQLLEEEQPYDQALKIISKLLSKLPLYKTIFIDEENQEKYFEHVFSENLLKFYTYLVNKKNSNWLISINMSIRDCFDCFAAQWAENHLLPKIYSNIRTKVAGSQYLIEAMVRLITRESSPSLINNYTSKVSVELSKSSKSYEREAALLYFYYATFYCSIQLFQQYRLGQKYLNFNTDKNFKVKTTFITHLPRMIYFLTRQEKIEHSIIISRLLKDPDPEIQTIMEQNKFFQNEEIKKQILQQSKVMKQKEKERAAVLNVRKQNQNRRSSKQLKKEDILKKKIQTTKSKTKIVIKQMPKKKVAPVLVKGATNMNFKKNS